MADEEIRPFKIEVSDADLEDLRERLRRARFPTELEDVGTSMGAPLADVKRLVDHWANAYDWRAAEATLNALPHFKTTLQVTGFEPLNLHFVHMRSQRADAIPLLFSHGWPGSFLEATKILAPLTDPGLGDDGKPQPAFHVVAPSLPGYGFSEGSNQRGFSVDQHGEIFHLLMMRLGYEEYATQGGDWGAFITRAMGRRYAPKHVKAQHINMAAYPQPSLGRNPLEFLRTMIAALVTGFSDREKQGFERSKWFQSEGMGYFNVQSTHPQTIGYALADSPTALMSWIYEKLTDWTDGYAWTPDEVCTWVTIYWFSTSGPRAAGQLYWELQHVRDPALMEEKKKRGIEWASDRDDLLAWQDVKIGLGHFPKDVIVLPAAWGRVMGNVVYEQPHEDGGHFAAWEKPEAIVNDLRAMFGKGGGAEGAVKVTKE